MTAFEYKAVPAPRKGMKAKGVRTAEDRFAHAITDLMNRMAADGWEYLRAELLPSEERSGWTGRTEVNHHLLVFRRVREPARFTAPAEPPAPRLTVPRDEPADATVVPRLGPARDGFAAQ
jgi:hypothetical protein